MSDAFELDPRDYHLRLLIERLQREGRSEAAIEQAVRIASGPNDGPRRPARRRTIAAARQPTSDNDDTIPLMSSSDERLARRQSHTSAPSGES